MLNQGAFKKLIKDRFASSSSPSCPRICLAISTRLLAPRVPHHMVVRLSPARKLLAPALQDVGNHPAVQGLHYFLPHSNSSEASRRTREPRCEALARLAPSSSASI